MTASGKWLMVVFVMFVSWKFFLIGRLWSNREIPPSPTDAYTYIIHIKSVLGCSSLLFCSNSRLNFTDYGSFEHLSYRLFFGLIGTLVGIDPVETFHLSFYLGTLFLFWILYVFLKSLGLSEFKLLISLLFLGLYYGAGSYHGFFWVVPSFFSLAIFLCLFSLIYSKIRDCYFFLLSTVLVIVGIYNHSMFLYLIFIYPVYFLLTLLYTKKCDWVVVYRIVFVVLVLLSFYGLVSRYLESRSIVNDYGYSSMLTEKKESNVSSGVVNSPKTNQVGLSLPSFSAVAIMEVTRDYINLVAPVKSVVILYLFLVVLLIRMGDYRVVFFWLSTLIFSTVSLINDYGVRSLLVTWPATYVFCAIGWVDLYLVVQKVKDKLSRVVALSLLVIALLAFVLLNCFYSLYYSSMSSKNDDYVLTSEIMDELDTYISVEESVLYSKLSVLLNSGLAYYEDRLLHITQDQKKAKYCLEADQYSVNSDDSELYIGMKNWLSRWGIGSPIDDLSAKASCPGNYKMTRKIDWINVYRREFD